MSPDVLTWIEMAGNIMPWKMTFSHGHSSMFGPRLIIKIRTERSSIPYDPGHPHRNRVMLNSAFAAGGFILRFLALFQW
jgi:hypothetical protein